MAMKRIIILSILFTQSLCAPSGCIESCTTTYRKVNSYRTHQVSSNLNDHADLVTDSNIRNINHLNLDYNRPGNWTEQNEYKTDGGHGKVYEEQGQYVEGSKRVRYFKKNYTSSYTNTHVNNPDLIQSERLINQNRYNSMHNTDSQRIYEQSRNSESYKQEHNYNKLHNDKLQQSYRGRESHNGRHEIFGELSDNLQVNQHGMSGGNSELLQGQNRHIEIRPGNWSQVNTYKTDGGHGRVFEEEGQYVTGPKTTRYYQQNYTSQYSTSTNPKHEIASNIHDLQNTIQKVNQEFKNLETEIHRSSHSKHMASSNTLHTGTINLIQDNVTPSYKNNDLQVAESADYRHRDQNEYMPTIGIIYNVPQNQLPNRQTLTAEDALYRNQDNIYNRNIPNIQHQREETYISQSHTNVLPSHIQPQISENSNYQRHRNNEQIGLQQKINEDYQREHFDTRQSQMRQNYQSVDNVQHSRLNENIDNYPYTRDQRIQHQQDWDAMGQRSEIVNTNPYDRNHYSSHHRSRAYNMEVVRTVGENYNPGYTAHSQQVVTGTHGIDPGMQYEDCTHEMEQSQHRYNRKYKRNADYHRHSDSQQQQQYGRFPKNLKHQPEKLAYSDNELQLLQQQNQDLTQQSEDLTQQTSGFDDLTQQTSGHLEFGQQTQNHGYPSSQKYEDLTQQNEDLTQQTGGFDDLTQQTSGHLEIGQQTQNHRYPSSLNQKYEDLTQQSDDLTQQSDDLTQQTGGFDDLTQQTSGHLEFGQQTQQVQNHRNRSRHNQRIEDLTQQSDDLTQQTGGFDDLTQQTSGNLEFGQQTQQVQNHRNRSRHNQRIEDLTQQSDDLTQQTGGFDDLTQQTSGNLEFGQQTQNHRNPNSLSQKYEDLTQQTGGFDDLTQQTSGHLEFGQQTQQIQNHRNRSRHNQRIEDLTQQSDDLTQQTGGFDDLTQQTSGNLEFGQQTQQVQNHRNRSRHNQRIEDLTQQSDDLTQQTGGFDDLTQQTSGNLEFGQQTQNHRNPNSLSQKYEDLTQQTGGFDDLTQQTSGHLEFGQQTQQIQNHRNRSRHNQRIEDLTQQSDDLTQQTGGFDDLTQQTSGHLEFGQQTQNHRNPSSLSQKHEDLTQQTGGFDDLTQQTSGHLEFGQQTQQTQNRRNRSRHNQHIEDLTQQSDDLTQQTGGFDDLTQQSTGHLEFGQHTQNHRNPNSLSQKYGDLTQQTGGFDDSTEQTSGHLELWQQTQEVQNHRNRNRDNQHTDDLTQQTSGHLEFGQQHQKPSSHNKRFEDFTDWSNNPTQTSEFDDLIQQTFGHLKFGKQLQNQRYSTSHNQQFTSEQYFHPSVSGTGEQSDLNENKPLHLLTPAPKPKWKPRYTTSNQFTTDINKESNVHIHHSSDVADTTISYQVSDDSKSNQEIERNNEFNSGNLQSSNQQEVSNQPNIQTVDKDGSQQHQQQNFHKRIGFTKGGHRFRHIYRQSTQSEYQNNYGEPQSQLNQDPNRKEIYKKENQNNNQENVPSQNNNPGGKIEPRILVAYGGGPYDANHSDDIFNHVTQNPSATLPPYSDGVDSWDIREKPREVIPLSTTTTVIPEIPETPEITEKVDTEAPPTFWTRLGFKFTTTFDKAKERAKYLFG
ncbi:probable serine/threonine-protein kinase yakA isoform X4 [Vespa mandarinia]|uniref:probable serine/threonine-protein kinase yakA isoform X4 n=1 Tax=Vespa mandarinia TaxID=7446 RepID=UPI00161DF377|nr:probable serine/threonine-protein kinase yakA isoform X4 [Vespa mandarinia]